MGKISGRRRAADRYNAYEILHSKKALTERQRAKIEHDSFRITELQQQVAIQHRPPNFLA